MTSHGTKEGAATRTLQSKHTKQQGHDQSGDVLLVERGDAEAMLGETYLDVSNLDLAEEIQMVRSGVPARLIDSLAGDMGISRFRILDWIKMPEATAKRKIRNGELLDTAWSERVLALASLIGRVQHMVEESGDATGFDAAAWIGNWLSEPNPAFGGAPPGEFMDTEKGSALVSQILLQMQSGAYA